MRYAVVDTGSNTIRLGIYDYENGTLKCIYNKAVFANLASYIENNSLTQDGIEKAAEALLIHKKTAEEYGCALSVFATAAIRNAKNCHEICESIKELANIDIDNVANTNFSCLFPCYAWQIGKSPCDIIISQITRHNPTGHWLFSFADELQSL